MSAIPINLIFGSPSSCYGLFGFIGAFAHMICTKFGKPLVSPDSTRKTNFSHKQYFCYQKIYDIHFLKFFKRLKSQSVKFTFYEPIVRQGVSYLLKVMCNCKPMDSEFHDTGFSTHLICKLYQSLSRVSNKAQGN